MGKACSKLPNSFPTTPIPKHTWHHINDHEECRVLQKRISDWFFPGWGIYLFLHKCSCFFPLVVVTNDQFAANTAKVRKIHDILLKLASKYQQIFLEKVIELHGSSWVDWISSSWSCLVDWNQWILRLLVFAEKVHQKNLNLMRNEKKYYAAKQAWKACHVNLLLKCCKNLFVYVGNEKNVKSMPFVNCKWQLQLTHLNSQILGWVPWRDTWPWS